MLSCQKHQHHDKNCSPLHAKPTRSISFFKRASRCNLEESDMSIQSSILETRCCTNKRRLKWTTCGHDFPLTLSLVSYPLWPRTGVYVCIRNLTQASNRLNAILADADTLSILANEPATCAHPSETAAGGIHPQAPQDRTETESEVTVERDCKQEPAFPLLPGRVSHTKQIIRVSTCVHDTRTARLSPETS